MRKNSNKKTLRQETLLKRDAIPENIKQEKDAAIRQRLIGLPEFTKAKTILFYASFRSEADTMELIKTALSEGKRVALPKVDKKDRRLLLYEIEDIRELAQGYMGILEPSASKERLTGLDDMDLIIIPGAAFDASGNRLGYGAGFYDRLLTGMKKIIPVIAPAYEEQIVEKIPSEPHDVKVSKIVTDKRVIECEGK
ncbi:MAG: 5-formyltetrahydrofolate cyclo-ligase [Nitrospirae bacterium CG22_combo_CG10-13_8_21_14_all_44_11]|nr:MAG: 5-formyltetrahydrofolate cyclo-ligase [Nitrospirae bacterium CG22_combo_CG10-13_8_21_14_all_44_11]